MLMNTSDPIVLDLVYGGSCSVKKELPKRQKLTRKQKPYNAHWRYQWKETTDGLKPILS
jgi:hypothetical protein